MSNTANLAPNLHWCGAKRAAGRRNRRSSATRSLKSESPLRPYRFRTLRAARIGRSKRRNNMAYIFHQDQLPKLVSAVPGRERIFFVNKELTNIDDMLAGVMYYKSNATSPFHLHENCE